MAKSTNENLDKRDISVKLSFNEIKLLLFKLRNYQISSEEGKISIAIYESLKTHLERQAKKGKLPPKLANQLIDTEDDCD